MKVKTFKEWLSGCDDNTEIVIEYKSSSLCLIKDIKGICLSINSVCKEDPFYKIVVDCKED